MKIIQKEIFVSTLLVFILNFHPILNVLSVEAKFQENISISSVIESDSRNSVPTDWSEINWHSEIVLPESQEEYFRERDRLIGERKEKKISSIKRKTVSMDSDEAMKHFQVPQQVRDIVRQFRDKKNPEDMRKLKERIQDLRFSGSEFLQSDESAMKREVKKIIEEPFNIIDLRTAPKFRPSRLIPATINQDIKIRIQEDNTKNNAGDTVKNRHPLSRISDLFSYFFQPDIAHAQGLKPLMSSYEGIEKNTMDFILYYLTQNQNPDGSFGSYNEYEITADIAVLLSQFNRTDNDQFNAMIQYLKITEPKNNREKAIKARIMVGLEEPYTVLLDEILLEQNEKDGGFGLEADYESDMLTTLEVALALYTANYSITDKLPKSLAYVVGQIPANGALSYTASGKPNYYLINKTLEYLKPFAGMSVTDGQNSISIQSKIDALLNYLVSDYDSVNETLKKPHRLLDEIMTLKSLQFYGKESAIQSVLKNKTIVQQHSDGSFGADFYPTAAAMKVFPQADLVISSLTGGNFTNKSSATLTLTFQNKGYKKSSQLKLYTFVDNVQFGNVLDLGVVGVAPGPNEQKIINLDFPDTKQFIGDTFFSFYVEDSEEFSYENNWQKNTFNFAGAGDGSPALPLYSIVQQYDTVGQLGFNVRWQHKNDPNRLSYVFLFREQGTSQWNSWQISGSWSGVFLTSNFIEGMVYETTVGVLHTDGQSITYFSDITKVQVTADPAKYTGTVKGQTTVNNIPTGGIFSNGYTASGTSDSEGNVQYLNVPNGTSATRVDRNYLEPYWTKFVVPVSGTTNGIRFFTRFKDDIQAPAVSSAEIRFKWNYKVSNQKESEILAFASDNLALKDADFYYWDPNESAWQYIGTKAFNSSEALLNWYVPSSLFGQGYKIKVVARDYRGNESLPKEWGPFEIIDGSPPVFTIISPNGAEKWDLGSKQEIKWQTESAHPVSSVRIYLLGRDGKIEYIASGIPNTGSYFWNISSSSQFSSKNAKIQIIGQDSVNYEQGTDESDGLFEITDTSPQPAFPWSFVEVSTYDTSYYAPAGGSFGNQQIAHGKDGTLHMIYRYLHDKMGDPRVLTEQLHYVKKMTDGTWTSPVKIYEKIWNTDGNLNGYAPVREPELHIDQSNRPHILWQNESSGGCSQFNNNDIWHMYFDGSQWSAPENISNVGTESRELDTIIDNQGRVHAVWLEGGTWTDDCKFTGQRKMQYRFRSPDGAWSSVQEYSGESALGFPQIAVTGDDIVSIAYRGNDYTKMSHIRWNGSSWTTPIFFNSTYAQDLDFVAGMNNTLHAVFRDYYHDLTNDTYRWRIGYAYFDGTAWSNSVEVTPVEQNALFEYPKIISDIFNVPNIVYEYYNGYKRNLVLTKRKPDNSWAPTIAANRSSQNTYNNSSDIVYNSVTQRLAATWSSDHEFGVHILYNEANLDEPPEISNLKTDNFIPQGASKVAVSATVSDTTSVILQAEIYYKDKTGKKSSVTNMAAVDGNLDSKTESVSALIDTGNWKISESPYEIYVRAKDSNGNWSQEKSTLVAISDKAFYEFDEPFWNDAKGQVLDSSGNGKHGTSSGGANTVSQGVLSGMAGSFDGIDDRISTPIPFTTATDLSISAWYKTDNVGTSRMALVGGNNGGRFEVYIDKGRPGCRIWDTSERSIFSPDIAVSSWHHAVCTQTYGAFPMTRLYVDGVLKKEVPYASISAGGYFQIGKPGSTVAKYYQGMVDRVAIYFQALSADQILEKYQKEIVSFDMQPQPDYMIARYNFDEISWTGAKDEIKDVSNHGYDATGFGGIQNTNHPDLLTGKVALFDGIDDRISTPIPFVTATDLSISAWYKTDNVGTARMALVGGNNGGRFEVYLHQGRPGCRIYDTIDRSIYTAEIYAGSWHHVVCTQSYGAAPMTRLYVDGVLKKEVPYASISAGGYFHIGKPGSTLAKYYQGMADRVKIYKKILTAEEINNLFQQE